MSGTSTRLKQAWARAKQRRRERIFILPTGFGLLFLFGVAIMIMIGAAYGNNLVNLLAYFLASLVVVAMVQTHFNLRDLRVSQIFVDPGPADGEVRSSITLENLGASPKYSIEVRAKGLAIERDDSPDAPILGRSNLRFAQSYSAGTRGKKTLERVQISTIYPLGLFRAWSQRDVQAAYWVWPKPKGDMSHPDSTTPDDEAEGDAAEAARFDAQDFRGHRAMSAGDSYRRVDWRAYAKSGQMLIKEFDGGRKAVTALDWNDTAALNDKEARLSQLTKWVEDLRIARAPFSLKLVDKTIGPGEGTDHILRCLEALATFPEERT